LGEKGPGRICPEKKQEKTWGSDKNGARIYGLGKATDKTFDMRKKEKKSQTGGGKNGLVVFHVFKGGGNPNYLKKEEDLKNGKGFHQSKQGGKGCFGLPKGKIF